MRLFPSPRKRCQYQTWSCTFMLVVVWPFSVDWKSVWIGNRIMFVVSEFYHCDNTFERLCPVLLDSLPLRIDFFSCDDPVHKERRIESTAMSQTDFQNQSVWKGAYRYIIHTCFDFFVFPDFPNISCEFHGACG